MESLSNILLNIVIPSLILTKGGKLLTDLSPLIILLTALAFPLSYGFFEVIKNRKVNAISVIGLVSISLTGFFSIMALDKTWIIVKEAGIPFLIGLACIISYRTPYPIVRKILFNEQIIKTDVIQKAAEESGQTEALERKLFSATILLSLSFFLSSFLNGVLAVYLLQSETGTAAFNEELGRMTALSFPVIALPSSLILIIVFFTFMKSVSRLCNIPGKDLFAADLT